MHPGRIISHSHRVGRGMIRPQASSPSTFPCSPRFPARSVRDADHAGQLPLWHGLRRSRAARTVDGAAFQAAGRVSQDRNDLHVLRIRQRSPPDRRRHRVPSGVSLRRERQRVLQFRHSRQPHRRDGERRSGGASAASAVQFHRRGHRHAQRRRARAGRIPGHRHSHPCARQRRQDLAHATEPDHPSPGRHRRLQDAVRLHRAGAVRRRHGGRRHVQRSVRFIAGDAFLRQARREGTACPASRERRRRGRTLPSR